MVDLSICIVSYSTRDVLYECMSSLAKQPDEPETEIIVVDNGSKDGSVEMLKTYFPHVNIIANSENLGFTVPMNQALKSGRGKYLVQLNPDTLVKPGALRAIFNYLENNPKTGICTPKVLNRNGTLQKQCRRSVPNPWDTIVYFMGLSRIFPSSRLFGRYLLTYLDESQISEVEAVSGSCMFIRREVIEQIGYLDEIFFAYQEDTDFCIRARENGWKVEYVPISEVIHLGGHGGTRTEVYRSIKAWHKSYELFYRKHMAAKNIFLVNWFMYAMIYLKLSFSLLQTFLRRDKIAGTLKP